MPTATYSYHLKNKQTKAELQKALVDYLVAESEKEEELQRVLDTAILTPMTNYRVSFRYLGVDKNYTVMAKSLLDAQAQVAGLIRLEQECAGG